MRRTAASAAGRIHHSGVRVHAGRWTLFAVEGGPPAGRLIVSLGRTAGKAVVRSRMRRIARSVFGELHRELGSMEILLAARATLGDQPRREVRAALASLLQRGRETLDRRTAAQAGGRG